MELLISRKKKGKCFLRINPPGYVVFSKALVSLLGVEDARLHGIQFGYLRKDAYIAFCDAPDRYQGNFRSDDRRYWAYVRDEVEKLYKLFGIGPEEVSFALGVDEADFTVYQGIKFYRLSYTTTKRKRGEITETESR
jgi:hypothetical protein